MTTPMKPSDNEAGFAALERETHRLSAAARAALASLLAIAAARTCATCGGRMIVRTSKGRSLYLRCRECNARRKVVRLQPTTSKSSNPPGE